MESEFLRAAKMRENIDLSTTDNNDEDSAEEYETMDEATRDENIYADELMELPFTANGNAEEAEESLSQQLRWLGIIYNTLCRISQTSLNENGEGARNTTLPDFIIDSIYDDYVDVDNEQFDEFAKWVLFNKFGLPNFKPLQLEIVKYILTVIRYVPNNNNLLNFREMMSWQ